VPADIQIVRYDRDRAIEVRDVVAVEEPLEIRVNAESLTVTMRTPGHDFDLVAGLLYAEGLIASAADLLVMKQDPEQNNPDRENTILTAIRPYDTAAARAVGQRNFLSASSCGVCGKKDIASTRSLAAPLPVTAFRVAAETIYGLNARMREAQQVFASTGGLHAAAIFNREGELLSLREDIGRHNAVDKLIGAELLAGRLPLTDRLMMISGRASFEILQKAAVACLPIVCAVSAPSSLAVQMARDLNITLIGFLRGETMNVYAGAERIVVSQHEASTGSVRPPGAPSIGP
jgi:FdhD protein